MVNLFYFVGKKLTQEELAQKLNITDRDVSKRENEIPQGADLIWKGCETATLDLREHCYDKLCEQAKEKGLSEDVKFYLEFFKYGCPPHGGFAIGVDRITMLLLETDSLKETMYLFRGPSILEP